MSDLDHARLLLDMADTDSRALSNMMNINHFDDSIFGFHAQQAVEKSLKAWIAVLGHRYPKTHDIAMLLEQLASHNEDVVGLAELIELYPFAVQLRYETHDPHDVPLDRLQTLNHVKTLIQRVANIVERDSIS